MSDDKRLNAPKYIELIADDINKRSTWNKKDSLIMTRRLGERTSKKGKYRNQPNSVVPIIDDTVRERSEQEVSMIMNAPRFAHFICMNPKTPADIRQKAEIAFDTYLRYFCNYRRKKDEEVDTKNARGFAVTKVIREDHPMLGTIPSFEAVDPKDIIVPPDTKDAKSAQRITHVLRYSISALRNKEKNSKWKNVEQLLTSLGAKDQYDSVGSTGSPSSVSSTTSYSQTSDETHPLKTTEKIIGLDTSNLRGGEIVVWEIYHRADEWDVAHDWTKEVVEGEYCMTYFCPDRPDILLNIKAWKYPDAIEVQEYIDPASGQMMASTTVTKTGEPMDCPYIQHRMENRSKWWYDSRGLGHLNMDNQIVATGIQNRNLVMLDYCSNPIFTNVNGDTNTANVKLDMGNVLPRGVAPAVMPQPPASFSFTIDSQKREASLRSGASTALFSGNISETRKVQKSATEVSSQEAQRAMLSSASVDRFNDSDKELFNILWKELKYMRVPLPLIDHASNAGMTDESIYDHDFLIMPASSQKTLNPDLQFMKFKEVMGMMTSMVQLVPNQDIEKQLRHGLAFYDPQFADLAIVPQEQAGVGGIPLHQQLQQMMEAIQKMAGDLEAVMKLSMETAEKTDKLEEAGEQEDNAPSAPTFVR